jgi:ADP-ribosylation factor family
MPTFDDLGIIPQVDAIVFLVDSNDRERFPESKKELDSLLSDDGLASVPFLVLGNKIDIPQAASEDELRFQLGLTNYTTGKGKVDLKDSNVRPIEVFMCSVVGSMAATCGTFAVAFFYCTSRCFCSLGYQDAARYCCLTVLGV